jgi:hypothetical protein
MSLHLLITQDGVSMTEHGYIIIGMIIILAARILMHVSFLKRHKSTKFCIFPKAPKVSVSNFL